MFMDTLNLYVEYTVRGFCFVRPLMFHKRNPARRNRASAALYDLEAYL